MRRVSQRQTATVVDGIRVPDSPPGDCLPACIASIFELDLDDAPGLGGRNQQIWDWLALNYPGIGMAARDWLEPRKDVHHKGFWIATTVSPRYRESVCHYCNAVRAESEPPYFWRRDECPHCNGTGQQRGLHAVVMEHGKLAWDPHPQATWPDELPIVGETYFTVTDPSRLTARVLPQRR